MLVLFGLELHRLWDRLWYIALEKRSVVRALHFPCNYLMRHINKRHSEDQSICMIINCSVIYRNPLMAAVYTSFHLNRHDRVYLFACQCLFAFAHVVT